MGVDLTVGVDASWFGALKTLLCVSSCEANTLIKLKRIIFILASYKEYIDCVS